MALQTDSDRETIPERRGILERTLFGFALKQDKRDSSVSPSGLTVRIPPKKEKKVATKAVHNAEGGCGLNSHLGFLVIPDMVIKKRRVETTSKSGVPKS